MSGTVEVLVYSADGSTPLAPTPVDGVLAVSAIDELDDVGGGSVTVALSSATLAAYPSMLDDRNVVKVRVNGTIRGAFIIRKRSEVIVGDGADASRAITVSGPGLLSWLKDAIVYPESPSPFAKATRHFSYGSKRSDWLILSDWGFASNVRRRGGADLTDRANPWQNRPVNWPGCSPEAWWIWDRPTADSFAPVGYCYFRRGFTTATPGVRYRVYFAADNQAALMLDGESLVSIPATADAFSRTWYADFVADTGDHVVGFKVRNLGGPAGLLAVLFEVGTDVDNRETLTQVWATGDGAWRINSYPAAEPGWTIGNILSQLRSEAASRGVGAVSRLVPTWGTATDSENVFWPRVAWKTSVGTPMLDAVRELKDFGCDLWVNPDTLAWSAYVSRGVANLDVLIDIAAHVQDLTEESEAAITNVLLIATGDQWAGARDDTSRSTYGRIEGYVDLSRFTPEQAVEVSQAILDRAKIPTEGAEVTYVPIAGNTPWVDFRVGDTVSVSTASGYRPRIVSSISVAMDDAGQPVYTVELDTIFRDILARLQQVINQAGLLSGSVAGQAGSSGGGESGTGNGGGDYGGGWESGGGSGGSGPPGDDGWGGGEYLPDLEWPGGGDDFWSVDDYLAGPGWTEGDPYGESLAGWSGGAGAGPALSPPGGAEGSAIDPLTGLPIDPTTTPWLPPTDPSGGSGLPGVPGSGGASAGAGLISVQAAVWMVDLWADQGTLQVALLTDANDGWATLTAEQDGTGYVREELLGSSLSAAAGFNPITRKLEGTFLRFDNTGAEDWTPTTHVAILAPLGASVLAVAALPSPVTVAAGSALIFPTRTLSFEVVTAP